VSGRAGGASFRSANAAQVCNNVGLLVVDSDCECSFATAARQTVSERWRGGKAEAPGPRSDISFRLDQKTANFKVAIGNRAMQWRVSTEEKQKNELAQNDFCFIKTITITMGWNFWWGGEGGAITICPSQLYQRCIAAKDGKFQGGQSVQRNAVECAD
jgi:hypothetical protein